LKQDLINGETAAYGHMGSKNEVVIKTLEQGNGEKMPVLVELFTCEKLDFVDKVISEFKI
jgi:S-adenosylmethionine synthetase